MRLSMLSETTTGDIAAPAGFGGKKTYIPPKKPRNSMEKVINSPSSNKEYSSDWSNSDDVYAGKPPTTRSKREGLPKPKNISDKEWYDAP